MAVANVNGKLSLLEDAVIGVNDRGNKLYKFLLRTNYRGILHSLAVCTSL